MPVIGYGISLTLCSKIPSLLNQCPVSGPCKNEVMVCVLYCR